jgi:CDGSH-type Zn-finger protein
MVRPNGPLICSSDTNVTIQDADGNLITQAKELALCRCGQSQNKPFCDGSHKKAEFEAGQEFTDERGEDLPEQHSELVITVKPDAMLLIKSPVTLFSRDGRSVTTRTKGALCRCGASNNKPFCDRQHKQCGFKG